MVGGRPADCGGAPLIEPASRPTVTAAQLTSGYARCVVRGPTTEPPSYGAGKAAWRRWARALRRALAETDPQRSVDAAVSMTLRSWPIWREARVALVYLAFGSEVDPLVGGLLYEPEGPSLVTTRTPAGGGPLRVHELRTDALERHPLGFPQPRADAPLVDLDGIEVALVPGLCFDARGARLGYGRGYYDRLLPLIPASTATVGVTREALVVSRLPTDRHDVAVRWLLTEAGLRQAGT